MEEVQAIRQAQAWLGPIKMDLSMNMESETAWGFYVKSQAWAW